MKKILALLTLPLLLFGCANSFSCPGGDYTRYVNPLIGSGGHGHVFVGANVPFGMVQLGPVSIPQSWDWCSGYNEADSTVIGFSHTHLSGTGIGDLFDVTVMPVVGEVNYSRGTEDDQSSGLWSYADRSSETVRPGYYSVLLRRYGVRAELTATSRVGMHRYTFPASENSAIVFDLENGGCWDKATDTHFEIEDSLHISGWRYSTGWAKDQKVYFAAEFSRPFTGAQVVDPLQRWCRLTFPTAEGEQILLKVAISPVSVEGARLNLRKELQGWDFDAVAENASSLWNRELSKVKVEDNSVSQEKLQCFYTALYHTMVAPSEFCDVNGDYRGADGKVHRAAAHTTYTTFSLWDTYRAEMPLLTILQSERMPDIINTMLAIHSEQGRLPVWHLWGNETDCMVGNPGIVVVADAIVKDIPGFDREAAFKALTATAYDKGRGGALRARYGYIPCDLMTESVAYDMEYAIADGAIAAAAKALGKEAEAQTFTARSHSYRHYFDPSIGFVRGLDSKGVRRTPFSPFSSEHRADDFCEGNAWQYTWLAPQDVEGLVECFGGRENMLSKLDSLFTVSSVVLGQDSSPDISGLIGQYAHGNEPSHHILYLYTMLSQPWKTADLVRRTLNDMYRAAPDGLSGNEDVGQMSAWYILSSLGFYEAEPASGKYCFGVPSFQKAEISLPEGRSFTITAENLSAENRYIQSIKLNGKDLKQSYIDYKDIMAGGRLVFQMGPDPKLWW